MDGPSAASPSPEARSPISWLYIGEVDFKGEISPAERPPDPRPGPIRSGSAKAHQAAQWPVLCSNLRNQFFIVMNWINKTDFSPVFDPERLRWQDMLMGNRSAPGAIAKGALLEGLPPFIKTQGTLLLLYLGMKGVMQIASNKFDFETRVGYRMTGIPSRGASF
jgi:hypothetical protein